MRQKIYPTPSQLLTKLLDMLRAGNEPGPGVNPMTLWQDGLHIQAERRENEYAIRLEADGKQSRPVLYLRTKRDCPVWQFAPQPLSLVAQWLNVVNPRPQAKQKKGKRAALQVA